MSLRVFIISFLLCAGATVIAQSNVDSLWRIAEQTEDVIEKVNLLNKIAYELRFTYPDSTLIIGVESEKIALQAGYQMGAADAKMRRAIAHTNLGNYYRALQLNLEAHSVYEDFQDKSKIAACHNNIGRLYNFIGDHRRALEYYKKASVIYEELDNPQVGNILNNIGYIYKVEGDYPQAIDYLKRSWKSAIDANDASRSVYPIYNIGSTYMLSDRLDSAYKYLDSSMQLSYQLRNQYILSLTKIDLGQLYLKQNRIKEAEKAFREGYNVASTAKMRSELRDASFHLSSVYERQNRLDEALRFQKIYQSTNDSLFNRDLARRMALQEAEYEYQQLQIQREIEQEKERLLQERELANAIWIRNTLIVGLLAMSLIAYLLLINFRRKRKANNELRNLNSRIETQAQKLQEANHEIIEMNNNLEKIVNRRTEELKIKNQQLKEYLSSNSHIVRAPLARILGLVDLYDPKDSSTLPFINESLQESATELDNALRSINEKLSDEQEDSR